MSKIEQWALDKEDHKSQQRAAFPMSGNRPRRDKATGRMHIKSPHSTRMTSQLMATTYRYRIITAATLLKYFQSRGEQPSTISQILRLALESMEDMVIAADPTCEFKLEHEALQFLQHNGIMNSPSPANQKRITGNLVLENIKEDGFSCPNSNEFTREVDMEALVKDIDARVRNQTPLANPLTNPPAEQTSDPHEMVKLMTESSPTIQQTDQSTKKGG